jgi:hypothetical protein
MQNNYYIVYQLLYLPRKLVKHVACTLYSLKNDTGYRFMVINDNFVALFINIIGLIDLKMSLL